MVFRYRGILYNTIPTTFHKQIRTGFVSCAGRQNESLYRQLGAFKTKHITDDRRIKKMTREFGEEAAQ